MDLVDEILKFSSILQKQENDPLRAGLIFRRFDEVDTSSDYDNLESSTTMEFVEGGLDHETLSQKVFIHENFAFKCE